MGVGGALGVEFWAAMGLSPRALLRLVPQPGLWASSLLSSGGGSWWMGRGDGTTGWEHVATRVLEGTGI